jgi:hypothetical protein
MDHPMPNRPEAAPISGPRTDNAGYFLVINTAFIDEPKTNKAGYASDADAGNFSNEKGLAERLHVQPVGGSGDMVKLTPSVPQNLGWFSTIK